LLYSLFLFNQQFNHQKANMQKSIPSSTGGTITFTATGLIHRTKNGAYSGKVAVKEAKQKPVKKIG
jgi:hypothetical protein